MRLDARTVPLPSGGSDEAWLTDRDRSMYAVGTLNTDRTGTFSVAPRLVTQYSALEVSV